MQRPTFVHTSLILLFVLFTTLHVTAQIVWLTKPLNTPVALGQDLVLNCHVQKEAQSGGDISVSWLFNQSAVQAKALRMANDSLFLRGVGREDEGEYTCVVEMVGAGGQVEREEESALVVIAYIKDFILQPENASAAIGSEAVLTCVTGRSAPYPMVHWELNGRKIESARTFAASYGDFDHTGLSDQISMKLIYRVLDGNPLSFQCVAVNPLSGETVKSGPAFVTPEIVDVPPEILTHFPPERVAREFQRLFLDCQAIGSPPPVVSWYKNGALIEDPKIYNFKIAPNDTLLMPSVRQEAAGVYSCEAENTVGIAQSGNLSIVVAYLELNFTTEPSHTSAFAGTSATLHCTPPLSVPPAEVTWYKDYAPFVERAGFFAARVVHNGTQRNLHFFSVQETDQGDYYCVATNRNTIPTGRTSVIARLTVKGAPVITEPPINSQVIKGTLLHLTCRVDLATVQSVFWTFNADMVQTSADVSIINHGQDLWINNVGKSWEGQYTCTAENSYGKKSASAVVSVIVPPVTLKSLGAKSVTVDYAILLPCFIYGDPGPAFVWYHNGTLVTGDAKHRLLTTGLYIDPVSIDDRGSYSCKGNNSGGFAWSNGTLDVTVPPTADTGEQQVAAVVGEPLTLRCQVQGHPFPSVLWLHNGTSSAERGVVLSQDNRTLTIPAFTWAHSGQYTCLAQNDVGSDMSTAVVSTQVKPKVLRVVGKTSVDVQRSLDLTCVVEGVPTPRITWLHDANSVQGTLNSRVTFPTPASLLVKFVTKNDEGVYECVATNIAGSSRGNVSVVIVEPPRPPKLLEAKALSVNSVFLRWEHVFQPPSTDVNAFVVHYRKRVAGDTVDYVDKMSALTTEKEIDGLGAGTEYVFTVSAENSAGQGIPSNPLSAVTFESGPSEPVNFRMLRTSATTATVAWETPSDTNGNIQRYQLQFKKQGEKDYSVLGVSSTSSPTQTVMLESLAPYTNYSLRVRGANVWQGNTMWGLFETLSLLTNMTVPSAAPLNVRATALDPFSVLVTWQPVPVSQQNGPITGYRVTSRYELKYAAAVGSLTRNASQDSATFRGLSPWTWYSFTVEAENLKGFSPKSDKLTIRTNPTAPTAPPQSVTVSALPGDILHVHWQPIPAKHCNSDLSVYVAQYRLAGDDPWTEMSTSDNKTLSISIRKVLAWSWYEVRVAAETRLVTPGRGPFSAVVQRRTLQAAAGPVRSVSYNVTANSIFLSWTPPLQLNGLLNGYRVDYHTIPLADSKEGIVIVNKTQTQLTNLHPDVLYNVSIATLNGAGKGNVTVLRVRTAPLPLPPTTAQQQADEVEEGDTMGMVEVTGKELTTAVNETSGSSRQLPVIVAGSLTGVAILVIILIIVLCRCYRSRRDSRAKYLINDGRLQGYGSGSLYRQMDDGNEIIITDQQHSSSPSPQAARSSSSSSLHLSPQQQQQQQQSRNSAPQQLANSSWFSQQSQIVEEGTKGAPMFLPTGGATGSDVKPPLTLTPPGGGDVFTIEDLENSFEDTGADNFGFEDKFMLPGLSSNSPASPEGATADTGGEETIDRKSSTLNRRKGRMRSESAAAIAVLRSASSTAVTEGDDTQFLLTNDFSNVDTEVIFKHRTVL